jgi:predicted RecA/RadA family phage recombinase
MSANYTGAGSTVQYTNAGSAIASGAVVIVGHLVGIAETAIAASGAGTVAIEGEYEVKAKTADAITVGMKLDWDASASEFVAAIGSAASGDCENGVIALSAKAGSTAGNVRVKLCPGSGTTT